MGSRVATIQRAHREAGRDGLRVRRGRGRHDQAPYRRETRSARHPLRRRRNGPLPLWGKPRRRPCSHHEYPFLPTQGRDANRIDFADTDDANGYDLNIQIAELNALNAVLAVIRWKTHFGFYSDLESEHYSAFTIDGNHLLNEDTQ